MVGKFECQLQFHFTTGNNITQSISELIKLLNVDNGESLLRNVKSLLTTSLESVDLCVSFPK